MTEKELIQKLQGLKKIKPSQTWVDFCRMWLEAKIDLRTKIWRASVSERLFTFPFFRFSLIKQLAPLAAGFIFILLTAGLVLDNYDSAFGASLYPAKIVARNAVEKITLSLTPENGRSALQIQIIGQHLNQLNKLVDNSSEPNLEQMSQAVRQMQNDLAVVKEQLPKLARDNKLGETVELAKTAIMISNKIPSISASMTGSTCVLFASSTACGAIEDKDKQDELSAAETIEMAQKVIADIDALMEKESLRGNAE